MRREAFRQSKAKAGVQPSLPPTIKPVFWLAPLPTDRRRREGQPGPPRAIPTRSTIERGQLRPPEFNVSTPLYWNYIKRLATEIREAAAAYEMPPLKQRPLRDVPSAFVRQVIAIAQPQQAASPVHGQGEPRHVRFVFVAGDPNEFGGVRSPAAYGSTGAGNWRPFYPQIASRIGPFVTNFVSMMSWTSTAQNWDSTATSFRRSKSLQREKDRDHSRRWLEREVEQDNQQILQQFDRDLKPYIINCSVLVPWNES